MVTISQHLLLFISSRFTFIVQSLKLTYKLFIAFAHFGTFHLFGIYQMLCQPLAVA